MKGPPMTAIVTPIVIAAVLCVIYMVAARITGYSSNK